MDSYAQVTGQLTANGQAGELLWVAYPVTEDDTGLSCGDDVGAVQIGPGRIYAIFGRNLHTFSRSTGEALWQEDRDNWGKKVVLSTGSLYYFGKLDDSTGRKPYYIRALDSSTGDIRWEHYLQHRPTGRAVVYEGGVYFFVPSWTAEGTLDHTTLISLDAATGGLNWSYQFDYWLAGSPVEYGGSIYLKTADTRVNYLYSVDPHSGQLTHRHELSSPYELSHLASLTPVIHDGSIYDSSVFGTISAYDLIADRSEWEYNPGGGTFKTPVLSGGNLYSLVLAGNSGDYYALVAIDAATGVLKWKYEPDETLYRLAVSQESVFVSTDKELVSLDALTGNLNWRGAYSNICDHPIIYEGVLYERTILGRSTVVYAIRAR